MDGDKNAEEMNKIRIEQNEPSVDELDDELDYVIDEAGQFSKYQIGHLVLMVLPIALSGLFGVNYIVTSATDEYRWGDIFFFCVLGVRELVCDFRQFTRWFVSEWKQNCDF